MAKKKVKIDIEKFLEATGFLYRLSKESVTNFDFSCIFEKDITLVQKRKLKRQFKDIPTILRCAFALGGFSREFKIPDIRKDIKITRNFKRGTWGAKVIKSKNKKNERN